MTKPPQIYAAIHSVASDLAGLGIAKGHMNLDERYFYRSIDDVLGCLAPLLAKHKLCVLPRVIERLASVRLDSTAGLLTSVALKVAFDLVSVTDGSSHSVEAYGEALDESDKATAKAMSAAYKSAMIQSFCIPVAGEDPDHRTRKANPPRVHDAEPVQGWEQWSADILDIVSVCESEEALERVRKTNGALLKAISRERGDLYSAIGESFASRTAHLRNRSSGKEVATEGAATGGAISAAKRPKGQPKEMRSPRTRASERRTKSARRAPVEAAHA